MNELSILLQAQGQGPSFVSTLVMMGAIFLVFWLILWRPQAQEHERHQKLISSLKKGDEVVTTGGLFGKVAKVEERVVTLEISRGTKIRVLRKEVRATQKDAMTAEESRDEKSKDADGEEDEEKSGGAW